jgi:hypothetical protein
VRLVTFLRCVCGELAAIRVDIGCELDDEHGALEVDDEELETFVHDHHGHLADDQYFSVIESAGSC